MWMSFLAAVCVAGQSGVIAQTGERSTITFNARHPESALERLVSRLRWRSDSFEAYDIAKQTYELYVPADYDSDAPYGLIVWVSPSDSGRPPENWLSRFDQHRLIWVGADRSGNKQPLNRRFGLALDAAYNMPRRFHIDRNRLYIAGLSGGGRVSSILAISYPEVYQGGMYIVGCNYYKQFPTLKDPNKYWPALFHPPAGPLLRLAKRSGRYVFLTGEHDGNRDQTLTYYKAYKADGFTHATYFEVPGMGHTYPPADWLEQGIEALDEPLASLAAVLIEHAEQAVKNQQWGRALDGYQRARQYAKDQTIVQHAAQQAQALLARRDDAADAAIRLVKSGDRQASSRALQEVVNTYGWYAGKDVLAAMTKTGVEIEIPTFEDPDERSQLVEAAHRQRRNHTAEEALKRALGVLKEDVAEGYRRLLKVSKRYRGTEVGRRAQRRLRALLKEKGVREAIAKARRLENAEQQLKLAEAYLASGRRDLAREPVLVILQEYADTPSAERARALAVELGIEP